MTTALRILIAEDEPAHAMALRRALEGALPLAQLELVSSKRAYCDAVAAAAPTIALLDLNLSDGSTIDLLTSPASAAPFPIVIMTSYGSEQLAVDTLKSGALDYLVKSAETFASIGKTIQHALREWELIQQGIRSQVALSESEAFLRTTLDALSAHIAILDSSGTIIAVNQAWRIFARENAAKGNVSDGSNYLAVCDAARGQDSSGAAEMAAAIRAVVNGEQSCPLLEYPCHSPDQQRWFMAKVTRFAAGGQMRVVIAHENITQRKLAELAMLSRESELSQALTELKEAQARVIQQEKMASIGQIAAGVAHEINNPMGYITSNLNTLGKYAEKLAQFIEIQEQALEECADSSVRTSMAELKRQIKLDFVMQDLRELIGESLEGSRRVSKIVQDLKSFARAEGNEAVRADLNECIRSTVNVVRNEIKYVADLQLKLGELPLLLCRPQQIGQVVMNLLVNAAHSISEKGVITLTTEQVGDWLEIRVADTGSGIAPEILPKIFEPFFTTKEAGKGTGLGLAISSDIVRKHGGELLVQSRLGAGTTFTVRLPLAAKELL